ncbi:hypothetical protein HPB50_017916 [Hyalomma asiaticum]|uniref:Uncharacterized protein n=1 Tax=Hyalomma asiaticum TaxID=266040 RepID=A0ACB7T3A9_HYAAI|nr:hypothetical protein HPB50_017916 [Hyalomma asiaticum]
MKRKQLAQMRFLRNTFEEGYEEAIQYDDRANQAQGHLKAKIVAIQASVITTSSVATPLAQLPAQPQHQGVKLPQLRLQPFNGELSSWQAFWECSRNCPKELAVSFHKELSRVRGVETSTIQSAHESAASSQALADNRLSNVLEYLVVET